MGRIIQEMVISRHYRQPAVHILKGDTDVHSDSFLCNGSLRYGN